jgi:hypothetical protein
MGKLRYAAKDKDKIAIFTRPCTCHQHAGSTVMMEKVVSVCLDLAILFLFDNNISVKIEMCA